MAVAFIPCLGPKGWITDGRTMLDQMLAWAYASDNSQSYFFDGDITSIAAILQKNAGKIEMAATELQESLTRYLGKVFDGVEIEVKPVEKQFPNHYLAGELMILGVVVDHTGLEIEIHEIMSNKGGAVRQVLDYTPT